MSSTAILVVGAVPADHPSGERRRCGKVFTTKPTAHFCTPDEVELINEDAVIKKFRRLSRGWFLGIGMEFTEDNVKRFTDADPTPAMVAKSLGRVEAEDTGAEKKTVGSSKKSKGKKDSKKGKTKPAPTGKREKASQKLTMMSSREDCVAALKAKGLVEGKQFNKDASRNDLVKLYNSL